MPSPRKAVGPLIMFVSDKDDEDARACIASLANAGAHVETVPDVYAATAKLSLGLTPKSILVDIRALDQQELAFLRLVPRFFAQTEVIVPLFGGTAERAARPGLAHIEPTPLPLVLRAVASECERPVARAAATPGPGETAVPADKRPPGPGQPSMPPEQDHGEATQPPGLERSTDRMSAEQRLSTDGGPEDTGTGPSMHEVVRERMSGADSPGRRQAPARTPPPTRQGLQPQTPLQASDPSLSPEEMDALLSDEPSGWDEPPSGTDRDEETKLR